MTDLKIKHNTYGSGKKTLVLFPGWIHPVENEEVFLKLLSKDYRAISIVIPGYLDAPDAKKMWSFDDFSQAMNRFLKKEKLENSILVGFSMGCRLITNYLEKYPHKTKPIFIGSPPDNHPVPVWAKIIFKNNKVNREAREGGLGQKLVNLLRKSNFIKKVMVNMALREASKDPKAEFDRSNISLVGAFDSLVALLSDDSKIEPFFNKATFVYGEKDIYLAEMISLGLEEVRVVKGAPHNCVRGFEGKVVGAIKSKHSSKSTLQHSQLKQ